MAKVSKTIKRIHKGKSVTLGYHILKSNADVKLEHRKLLHSSLNNLSLQFPLDIEIFQILALIVEY